GGSGAARERLPDSPARRERATAARGRAPRRRAAAGRVADRRHPEGHRQAGPRLVLDARHTSPEWEAWRGLGLLHEAVGSERDPLEDEAVSRGSWLRRS